MSRWRDETRRLTKNARSQLKGASIHNLINWERTYLRRMIQTAALDGSYTIHIDALWHINVEWLRDEEFMVLGNDDTGYDISWGKGYRWN